MIATEDAPVADLARGRSPLTAALGFALLDTKSKPAPPAVPTVRKWRGASAPGIRRVLYPMAMMRRLLLLLLAGAMVALTPAAHASPPDQTWIAGLYDNADYDDAVLAVIASIASLDRQPLHDPQYVDRVIAFVLTIDESLLTLPSLSSNRTRAPPAP